MWPNLSCRSLARAALLSLCLSVAMPASAKNMALLVGISKFNNPDLNLEGPVNDVLALRDSLVTRWGFKAEHVVTLTDRQATRAAVLTELERLEQRSESGDEILIYFSTHGTSMLDSRARAISKTPSCSGALAMFDTAMTLEGAEQTLLQGRRDLKPVLQKLDAGGRRVWVISDSCFSGQLVRGSGSTAKLQSRYLPLPGFGNEIMQNQQAAALGNYASCDEYPYRSTVFLSASSEGEQAMDIKQAAIASSPTITLDGKPHGAMTDTLLRVLNGEFPADYDRDGALNLIEVHRAVSDSLLQRGFPQTPQKLPVLADDTTGLSYRSLLGKTDLTSPPPAAQALALTVSMAGDLPPAVAAAVKTLKNVVPVGEKTPFDIRLAKFGTAIQIKGPADDVLSEFPAADIKPVLARLRQFAWSKKTRATAGNNKRGILALDFNPARFGGNYLLGEQFNLVLRNTSQAHILLVNVDAIGNVSVLYPFKRSELMPVAARQNVFIPGETEKIRVKEPIGTDMLFAFAFENNNPLLEKLLGLSDLETGDPRLIALDELLQAEKGRFDFAYSELRTSAKLVSTATKP